MAAILQIIGFKNSGKTTLLNALIRASRKENYTVSAIKHDAHDFSVDHAGTDSYSFQESGAEAVVIANSRQYAVMEQTGIDLKTAIQKLPESDIVLIEGYKEGPFPKIILVREQAEIELLNNSKAVHKIATHNPALKKEAIFIGEKNALNLFAETLIKEFLK
ncbi:TPA: molybdopterin-guanine dinucleotide biosynthesis protein B [Listeria monocytogenes]|uniref:Molybdopterin-guanine dinucleotide biosynthesis protein B n=1 Tax=Listeria monocytogenes TaxID=1639 RepID=A0A3T2CLY6_LISMN|nr:molybdopterin-guanine dinucleotide biosynthesis protein B [Listeria monocytogenes]EAF3058483.1 molybdopterin-guanine dinucleotide biosynthesis protein B [Listeria monocytogenes serotype 1/2a]EAF4501508.1 molybdopterin-guanine dinucleotide biosynthesis protein B [Listeria monocytogenes serotype 4b]EHC6164179.1 molybdopterin-guanine dinucleotide biosynthesis protein B [Listeria monocytogenes serotype 1/2b]AEO03137.1 molybdopterin-guanine dinucleotide biosynthesis protein B [Listeria monocytoge